ncbi:head scaffolding protein [Klebsiella phage VLCpiS8a]|nr:head scaffolding protein [Klebsiella phage VLCpiS8a]
MWKYLINKEAFDALTPEQQAAYKAVGDTGNYVMNIEGMPDVQAMQQQLTDVQGQLTTINNEKAQAAEQARLAALELAKKNGDFKTIEEDYKRQIAELNSKIEGFGKQRKTDFTNSQIDKLAMELGGKNYAELFKPVLRERLAVEGGEDGGEFITRVLKDGKPSAMSVTELAEEFRANPMFKPICVAPASSGTGKHQAPNPTIPAADPNRDAGNPRQAQLTRAEQIAQSIDAGE